MPKLSIIIATFNSEKTLRKALESVYTQDFQDWECVVVDGASTDETLDIVKEYVAKDSRFRYISEPDKGIYDAFNKGWRQAKGEWIHYLGSDDRLVKDGFKNLFLQDIHADLVGGAVYLVRDDEKDILQETNLADGCHQAFITKRKIIEGQFQNDYFFSLQKQLKKSLF